jgi:hypothetical protein
VAFPLRCVPSLRWRAAGANTTEKSAVGGGPSVDRVRRRAVSRGAATPAVLLPALEGWSGCGPPASGPAADRRVVTSSRRARRKNTGRPSLAVAACKRLRSHGGAVEGHSQDWGTTRAGDGRGRVAGTQRRAAAASHRTPPVVVRCATPPAAPSSEPELAVGRQGVAGLVGPQPSRSWRHVIGCLVVKAGSNCTSASLRSVACVASAGHVMAAI